MTDREIIKALGCCTHNSKEPSCSSCPARCGSAMCIYHTMKNALDLITRQQEEIDMLQKKLNQKKILNGKLVICGPLDLLRKKKKKYAIMIRGEKYEV